MSGQSQEQKIDDGYERVLLVKPTVYVYRIPPLTSASRGFRAADWNLSTPDWTGRIRVISKNDECYINIEDPTSGQLYARAPILAYPGPQLQPVSDSSRYFVIKVVSDTGKTALLGIGFADGSDSFDLNVTLRDFFTSLDCDAKELQDSEVERPKLDLSLKGDIKVKLNLGKSNADKSKTSAPKCNGLDKRFNDSIPFILPPPPSSKAKK